MTEKRKTIKIAFVDFWKTFEIDNNFIKISLTESFNVILLDVKNMPELKEQVEYLFYGDFGSEHLNYKCIRIYFTGENLFPDFNSCDYAIGFEYLNIEDRYFRLPLYLANYQSDYELFKHKHENITKEYANRKFCSMVVSNNWHCSSERENFFYKLSEYKTVDSGGRYLNNISLPDGVPDKNVFQKDYKFSICFENSSSKGYCTEKLMQGFAAKTVPIYWGDPCVTSQFNKNAFINCHDFESFEAVIEYIKKIDNDDALYLKILSQKAADFDILDRQKKDFSQWLNQIISKDYNKAFNRKLYGLNLQKEENILKNIEICNSYNNLIKNKADLLKSYLRLTFLYKVYRGIRKRFFRQ